MSSPEKIDRSAGHLMISILRWFDSEAKIESITATGQKEVDWLRIVPLLFLHLMCLGVFHFHYGIVACHGDDQLTGSHVWQPKI